MGHGQVVVKVEQSEYKPKAASQQSGYWRTTPEDELVSIAIDNWTSRDDCDRNASPSLSRAVVKPPMAEELAYAAANEWTDRDQNIIIPLISKKDYIVKKKTITVKLDDAEWKQYTGPFYGGYTVIKNKLEEIAPELVGKISEFKRVVPDGTKQFDKQAGWTVRSTVDADTSGGKAKTQYFLVGDELHKDRRDIKYFDSQAEARAWGVEVMNNNPQINKLSVEARIRREDNSAVVKLTRKVSSAVAKFEVSYIHMKTTTPSRDGWVVGFDYHV